MSYLAFDLDALKMVPDAARAAGLAEADLGYGLVRLWSYCWTEKTDTVRHAHLAGFFGSGVERVATSLVAFGFLRPWVEDRGGFEVRGASRYLRVKQSRSDGAKKTNEKRWGAVAQPVAERSLTGRSTVAPATEERSLPVALTPSSEQRAASSELISLAGASPAAPAAKTPRPPKEPKPKAPTDPRHKPMVDRLVQLFDAAGHGAYAFSGGFDAAAVTRLLAFGPDDEIANRWWRALRRTGFPLVRTLPELVKNWNHFASDATGATRPGAPVPAESQDWSNVVEGEARL